jgi:hypothetical protein
MANRDMKEDEKETRAHEVKKILKEKADHLFRSSGEQRKERLKKTQEVPSYVNYLVKNNSMRASVTPEYERLVGADFGLVSDKIGKEEF